MVRRPASGTRRSRSATVAAAVAVSAAVAACGGGGTGGSGPTTPTGHGSTTTRTQTALSGKQVFTIASCGSCHTFAAAGSDATIGPNLDAAHPTYAEVVSQVTTGGGGMPSFSGDLSTAEIAAVAKFVSSGGH